MKVIFIQNTLQTVENLYFIEKTDGGPHLKIYLDFSSHLLYVKLKCYGLFKSPFPFCAQVYVNP